MKTIPKVRFFLVIAAISIASLLILIQYALLIGQGSSEQSASARANIERGTIVDRHGKVLAAQVRRYDIYVRPPRDRDREIREKRIENLAADLALFLDMEAEDIKTRISSASKEFALQREVSAETWESIRNAQSDNNERLQGVYAWAVPFRVYPERNLAAQILGFMGNHFRPLEGIEYGYDAVLSGRNTGGKGNNIVLTIDANVQHILERVAFSAYEDTGADMVMFLAMDPRNGEILGSAIVPGYDPNNYRASHESRWRNYPAEMQFEPGSVFKVFSVASLMDTGAISESTEFICTGVYERIFPTGARVRISCVDGRAHGRVGPREIVTLSCNVGASYAADSADNAAFYRSLTNFGFGARTGTWVNAETAGLLKSPGSWTGSTSQSIAFGQEIAVSALQVMQAASVIANDGVLVPPKLISQIVSADGKTVTNWDNPNNRIRRVISAENSQKVLGYMTDTTFAMGRRAGLEDINLAVKTGTSQMHDPDTGRYSRTNFIASTLALLPAESPSLILYVVIIKPEGDIFGALIAAPAIREAAEELIDYLGIPRGRNPIVHHPGNIDIPGEILPPISTHVPDFTNLSKKTLVPLLFRSDIRVEIFGDGWVRRQSPLPGTPITPATVIELELE
ncbi:MAG: transpeptidase family protein [Treponema sp.]|nr:transpeptidase family protein [Treponema sp.]